MKTITRFFDNYADAQAAVRELETTGVPHSEISIVASNAEGGHDAHGDGDWAGEAGHDARKGAGVGGALGGAGGLLAASA